MKNLILICLIVLYCFKANAQFTYTGELPGGKDYGVNKKKIEQLKSTTIVFIVPDYVYAELPTYQYILQKHWTVTPFLIKPIDSLENYFNSSKYSIFAIDQTIIKAGYFQTGKMLGPTNYRLWMPIDKKNKLEMHPIGNIELMWPELETSTTYPLVRDMDSGNVFFLYKRRTYIDFLPGYFTAIMQHLNDELENGYKRDLNDKTDGDFSNVASLKVDTLYILNRSLVHKNIFMPGYSTSEEIEETKKEIKEIYPYPIKFVDAAEMSERIMNPHNAYFYTNLTGQPYYYVGFFNNKDCKPAIVDNGMVVSKGFFKRLSKAVAKAN